MASTLKPTTKMTALDVAAAFDGYDHVLFDRVSKFIPILCFNINPEDIEGAYPEFKAAFADICVSHNFKTPLGGHLTGS